MNTTNTTNLFVLKVKQSSALSFMPVKITNILLRKAPLIHKSAPKLIDGKELALASLILLINLPLLLVIFGRKTLRERKSHQLFVNICVVHILAAISIIASNFSEISDVPNYLIVNNGLLIEMFEMLMVMSLERLLAINYSFEYLDVRKRHIIALLVCTWVLPLLYVIMGILYGFSENVSLIISTILINAATIILGIINLMIYGIAKRHDKFIKENVFLSAKSVPNEKSLKASYTCFSIVASFMVLWTPYCIHNIARLSGLYDETQDRAVFSQVVDFIAYLHGIVNPLSFIWLSQATKKEINMLLDNIRCKCFKDIPERTMLKDSTKWS